MKYYNGQAKQEIPTEATQIVIDSTVDGIPANIFDGCPRLVEILFESPSKVKPLDEEPAKDVLHCSEYRSHPQFKESMTSRSLGVTH